MTYDEKHEIEEAFKKGINEVLDAVESLLNRAREDEAESAYERYYEQGRADGYAEAKEELE